MGGSGMGGPPSGLIQMMMRDMLGGAPLDDGEEGPV